ncbi:unnamed protein product, partial [Iphiclides podalirius]
MSAEGDAVKVEGGHVSVTTISMSGAETSNGQFSYSSSGVRISVSSDPHDEDSTDAEISKIDFTQHQYEVNMRNKKKRSGGVQAENQVMDRERPMSWEGELSDSEMVIDTSVNNDENSSSIDMQSSRDSVDTLRNVTIKTEPLKGDAFQSLDDQTVLDLKYSAPLQPHQRSLSMNRISVLTDNTSLSLSRRPSSPTNSAKSLALSDQGTMPMMTHVAGEAQNLTIKKETQLSELKCEAGSGMEKLLALHGSPLLGRLPRVQSSASTDSAVHSMYTHSVYSSPSASPRPARHYTPSLSRNNSDASHSSCYSYSSEFSPTHSPVQSRQPHVVYREASAVYPASPAHDEDTDAAEERLHHHQGISRQQLINSPCPICGDKISGFHYGIFSCESCKGFFKRTVQNRKNYMCLRGGNCPVTVATRKKCPACRFDKCLGCGMKLEAIREDRTRGGRSTYQCSYSLSGAASTGSLLSAHVPPTLRHASSLTCVSTGKYTTSPNLPHTPPLPSPILHPPLPSPTPPHPCPSLPTSSIHLNPSLATFNNIVAMVNGPGSYSSRGESSNSRLTPDIPPLLQEIMDVEHLWQYNESELSRLGKSTGANPLLAASGITPHTSSADLLADLCHIADHRLYKIVKWCKSLPLFKNISIDDQICLLINSWCELLVLSCCYRGVSTPGEVRVGGGRGITLHQSAKFGLTPCIERMLSFTDHLRRLRVDRYEYVALKVIVLLTSDAPELREAEKVRASQEKALAALQAYTAAHSPDTPAKFGELLLRIPELQRTCQFFMQVGKEMLNPANKSKDGDGPSFNLLMELLRVTQHNKRFTACRSLRSDQDGFYAYVGYWWSRGPHTLNLADDCYRQAILVHEWLHIIGFFHMQSTYNRDEYVRIVWENVEDGEMGQLDYVTFYDWLRVRRHYNCPGACPKSEMQISDDGKVNVVEDTPEDEHD